MTNAYLRNNIGSDNGLLTNGNDLWVDAGDGTVVSRAGPIASHAYARGGLHRVRVWVTDTAEQQSSATGYVWVY